MLSFLMVLNILIVIIIVGAVFLHNGPDGFLGESTPSQTAKNTVRFEAFDKVIAGLVLAFFSVVFIINYIYLYKDKGTTSIDEIIAEKTITEKKELAKKKEKNIKADHEAPIAP